MPIQWTINWALMYPEIVALCLAVLILAVDLIWPNARKEAFGQGAAMGLCVVLALVLAASGLRDSTFGGLFILDPLASVFKAIIVIAAILVALASSHFVPAVTKNVAEYYALLLFSTTGLMLMASAGDLLTTYLAIELSTVSLYVLAGYITREPRSAEAGLKYLLLGAIASGILIYGASLVFGSLGTTRYAGISATLASRPWTWTPTALLGLLLVGAGFAFKVTASPFHMWAPDVYHGAPTPVTAFLSVASKSAGFSVLMRVFLGPFFHARSDWAVAVVALCALSMVVGNLVAIPQTNIKRMLAYSGIAQAGYVLLGVAALTESGAGASMFYLAQYVFTNAGAFLVVAAVASAIGSEEIRDYSGLAQRNPPLAFAMLLLLLSLGGIPPLAGFWAKVYVFVAAVRAGLWWLVLLAALLSVLALYYYLMVVKHMYIFPPIQPDRVRVKWSSALAIGASTVAIILMAYPKPYIEATTAAARAAFHRPPAARIAAFEPTSMAPAPAQVSDKPLVPGAQPGLARLRR